LQKEKNSKFVPKNLNVTFQALVQSRETEPAVLHLLTEKTVQNL